MNDTSQHTQAQAGVQSQSQTGGGQWRHGDKHVRRIKNTGLKESQAAEIVEVQQEVATETIDREASRFVTREHFDAQMKRIFDRFMMLQWVLGLIFAMMAYSIVKDLLTTGDSSAAVATSTAAAVSAAESAAKAATAAARAEAAAVSAKAAAVSAEATATAAVEAVEAIRVALEARMGQGAIGNGADQPPQEAQVGQGATRSPP